MTRREPKTISRTKDYKYFYVIAAKSGKLGDKWEDLGPRLGCELSCLKSLCSWTLLPKIMAKYCPLHLKKPFKVYSSEGDNI